MTDVSTIEDYEKLQPVATVRCHGIEVTFSTPNRLTLARAQTLFTKEPETIDWIASFVPGDVFVDVGANVGIYTIWAAKSRDVRVFAFEPESQNFALLNRNIQFNGLSEKVTAYCAALSDETRFDRLYLYSAVTGDSCHSFGEQVDHDLQAKTFPFVQGCFATTLDRLVEENVVPPPNHIKIDVDGFEHKVLAGASRVLESHRLNSVLVEINTRLEEHLAVVDRLTELGFQSCEDQMRKSQVKDGRFAGIGNCIFRRPSRIQAAGPFPAAKPQVANSPL